MKVFLAGIGGGFGATLAILLVVLWTGATFGQRCAAKGHEWHSDAHDRCVEQLRNGN